MTPFFRFKFSSLPQVLEINFNSSQNFVNNKDFALLPFLLTETDVVKEIKKKIDSFISNTDFQEEYFFVIIESPKQKLPVYFMKHKFLLEQLKTKLDNLENQELSSEEWDFLNKSCHLCLQDQIFLSFTNEEENVSDFLTDHSVSPNQVFFHIYFEPKRGFNEREIELDVEQRHNALPKSPNHESEIQQHLETEKSLIIGNFESEKFKILKKFVEISAGETDFMYWKLVYRATRDGFGGNDFHAKCDNPRGTLIIIKTANGSIFGGFTTKSWSEGYYGFARDDDAFIFSLFCPSNPNREARRFSPTINPDRAIYCNPLFGPCFGEDISISGGSNTCGLSFGHLNDSYDAGFICGSTEAVEFFSGFDYFQVKEIEAYSIDIFQRRCGIDDSKL